MTRFSGAFWLTCLLVPAFAAAAAEEAAPESLAAAMTRAQQALAGNDVAAALGALEAADRIAPGHPRILFHLARSQAQAGRPAEALDTLFRVAAIGGTTRDLAAEPAFATLHADPKTQELLTRWREAGTTIARSAVAFELDDKDFIPEGIAHDARDGAFFVGSLHRGSIVRVRADGIARTFVANAAGARPGEHGQVLGLRVDPARNLLWAATLVLDDTAPRFQRGPGGRTALRAFDLSSGTEVAVHSPPEVDRPHLLNDIDVAPGGAIHVTDSEGNAVYRLSGPRARLERVHGDRPDFTYPNGLATTSDGRWLFVAHAEGLSRIPLDATGEAARVRVPAGGSLSGIDGLYACGRHLIAVQAALDVDQVVHLALDPTGAEAIAATPLERGHPLHEAATTGTLAGDAFFYIANSQLGRLGQDGTLTAATETTKRSAVLRLPLGGRCGESRADPRRSDRP